MIAGPERSHPRQPRLAVGRVWPARLGRDLSREDARQIAENVTVVTCRKADTGKRTPPRARGRASGQARRRSTL